MLGKFAPAYLTLFQQTATSSTSNVNNIPNNDVGAPSSIIIFVLADCVGVRNHSVGSKPR